MTGEVAAAEEEGLVVEQVAMAGSAEAPTEMVMVATIRTGAHRDEVIRVGATAVPMPVLAVEAAAEQVELDLALQEQSLATTSALPWTCSATRP